MDMSIITNTLSGALSDVLCLAILVGSAYAIYYLRLAAAKVKAMTAQIKDVSAREVLTNALDDVVNLATTAVEAMEQTTAKALREAVKAGTADREQLLALGKQVFDEVKGKIGPQAQEVITENLGSFDDYLKNVIEAAVLHLKQNDPYTVAEEVTLECPGAVPGEVSPGDGEQ